MTFFGLLLACVLSVTHAPGWSDPVISIGTPYYDYQRKAIEVTDGNQVHQIWGPWGDLGDPVRLAYNIVLPDGTVLFPDTIISRDVWSSYPSACLIGTDFFGVWRESSPIWFARRDHEGNPVLPPTLFTDTPWAYWWYVGVDSDSLGRVHMSYDTPDGICYSIMIPGPAPLEVFRDTIPQSRGYTLLDVNGDRVHILYKSSTDWMPRYVQYDLDGNQTIGPILFVDPSPYPVNNRWSLCSDYQGNACIFFKENADNAPLQFTRIDRTTGDMLVDGRVIIQFVPPSSVDWPLLEPGPWGASLHLLWLEEDDNYGPHYRLVRHAIIDLEGDFIVEPYTAYDYTDEDPEDISHMVAAANDEGDLFITYSEVDMSLPGYWIRLGWFDHNYLGVEDDSSGVAEPALVLSSSCNPFTSSVSVTCEGPSLPGQLMVYDITGRLIRSLSDRQGPLFLWDGRDGSGSVVPAGTYLIQGAIDGQVSSIRIVKL